VQTVPVCNRPERAHIAHQSIEVDRQDRLGLRSYRRLDLMRIEVAGIRFDLDKNRSRSRLENGRRRGDETHRRGDDFVARSDIEREQGHVQGAGATRDCERVPLAQVARELRLERRYRLAGRQDVAFEHPGKGVKFDLAEVMTEVGDFPVH
jgi:hypothetical protein